MPAQPTFATPRRARRGVVSLVVVVLLLAAMAAATLFVSRSLITEQGTSANQYRATLAMEASEAGIQWATAMLNKVEKVSASCGTSTTSTDQRFRQKYLTTDLDTGIVAVGAGTVHAACVSNQNTVGWTCSCPAAGTAPSPSATAPSSGYQPSFAIAFQATTTPGAVRVVSYGCTSPITSATCDGDAAATVTVVLGSVSALPTPPAAALTARGSVSVGNAALGVINGDPSTNGITINAGLSINAPNARLITVPGTPPQATLVGNDPSIRGTSEEQMFTSFFGMTKESYRALSTVKTINCAAGCTEADVTAAYAEGARLFWLDGNLAMNANITIGSETDPVLMVVGGNVGMQGDLRIFGLIYSEAITWDNTGGGSALLQGAAISEGNYTGNGTPDYLYDPRVIKRLRLENGSYARVPGSWRDF